MTQEQRFCTSAAARVAEVPKSTLRSWRKFNGLFARPGQWHRYSFAELCVIRAVGVMTRAGIRADVAAGMAAGLVKEFDSGRSGFVTMREVDHGVDCRFDLDAIRKSVEALL